MIQFNSSCFDYCPHYLQLDAMDCGPTCLRMIAKHYVRSYPDAEEPNPTLYIGTLKK